MDQTSSNQIKVGRCSKCGKLFILPVCVCSLCGSEEFTEDAVAGKGIIYTHTTIRVAPEAFQKDAPYPIAIVELPQGLRLTARMTVTEGERIEVGKSVQCVDKNAAGYWFQII
jgi:uncharacterized OB-fold protein